MQEIYLQYFHGEEKPLKISAAEKTSKTADNIPNAAELPEIPAKKPQLTVDEDAVLSKISEHSKYSKLFRGEWIDEYPSQSEADLSLCAYLMILTENDSALTDKIFRNSGLFRDKWDEKRGGKTYGEMTIENAYQKINLNGGNSKMEKNENENNFEISYSVSEFKALKCEPKQVLLFPWLSQRPIT